MKYRSLAQMIDDFKSKRAAACYAGHAIRAHKTGMSFRGHPLMKYKKWCEVWTFLVVDEQWLTEASKELVITRSGAVKRLAPDGDDMKAGGAEGDNAAEGGPQKKPRAEAAEPDDQAAEESAEDNIKQDEDAKGKPAKAKAKAAATKAAATKAKAAAAKAKASAKKKKKEEDDEGEPDNEEEDATKAQETKFASLKGLKMRLQAAMSTSSDYMAAMDTKADAVWAKLAIHLAELEQRREKIKAIQTLGKLWEKWVMDPTGKGWNKVGKEMDFATLAGQLSHTDDVTATIVGLEKAVSKVARHRALELEE